MDYSVKDFYIPTITYFDSGNKLTGSRNVRRGRWLPDVWRQAYEKNAMESAMSKAGQTGHVNIETDGRRPRQRHPCVWRKASRLDATSTIAALVCRGTRAFQWKGQGRANGRSRTCTARLFMWRREVGKTVTVIPPGRARAASYACFRSAK